VHVRPGHDSFFNSHAGFSGTYASQFAVTGLGAVKGAADALRAEIAETVTTEEEIEEEIADLFRALDSRP